MRVSYMPDPPAADTPAEDLAVVERIRARRAPRPPQALDRALLHNAAVADGWNSFLGAVRTRTSLPAAVRELVADHALDEGRHHAYFRTLLRLVWPRLDRADRAAVGPLLPELMRAFLEPDVPSLEADLRAVGLSRDEARGVLAESLPAAAVDRDIAAGAASAVRYFREVGALDDPATAEAFESARLVV